MLIKNTNHQAQFEWVDVHLTGGAKGIVGTSTGDYFVEVYPKNLRTFIRGEGKTVAEAEIDAWEQYQRILNCQNHEFERKGYKNGAGIFKHCNLFKRGVFEPSEKCVICNCSTFWVADIDGNYYCEEHEENMPEDNMYNYYKMRKGLSIT